MNTTQTTKARTTELANAIRNCGGSYNKTDNSWTLHTLTAGLGYLEVLTDHTPGVTTLVAYNTRRQVTWTTEFPINVPVVVVVAAIRACI